MKAIITDLDGTILPQGENISTSTLHTLEQLGAEGIIRIIATGRTLFAARKFLPDNFPIDYLVFSSGAGIMRWRDKKSLPPTISNPKKPGILRITCGTITSISPSSRKSPTTTIFITQTFIPDIPTTKEEWKNFRNSGR